MEIDQIKKILNTIRDNINREYKAEIIGIFGSFSRGEGDADSDVDVFVRFLKGATLFDLIGLGQYLEETLGRSVDIVSENSLRDEIKENIMKDLVKV